MNKSLFACMWLLASMPAFSQTTLQVKVSNNSKTPRSQVPVVVQLASTGVEVKSALVTLGGEEIPCQIDDLDQDGRADELCFIADIGKKATLSYQVTLYDNGHPRSYTPQVYAEMMLVNRKIKETNKQDLYISHLEVDKGVNPYWSLHHHGAAFENDMVAYRIYFDHRQTVDIYGKYRKGLELKDTQFYPDQQQKQAGYGDDVLWVGSTLGLGTLRGWDGKQPVMLQDVEKRSQRIVARGALRTIVEVKDMGYVPAPGLQPVDMTTRYTLYAGQRACDVDVTFSRPLDNTYTFCTGFINVKQSTEFSDHKGLRGCWGTDWPVSAKDSVGHKRETVGLGIYIPEKFVVSEEPANKDNYAFTVRPVDGRLHYKITFCSDNETFGYHTDKAWYAFLESWKKEIIQSITVSQ